MPPSPLILSTKLAVLVSGNGTNLQAILDAIAVKRLTAQVAVVVSDNPHAYALSRAKKAGIDHFVVQKQNFASQTDFEAGLLKVLEPYQIEFVVLAGFMRILSPYFLKHYPERIVNIHPSLLPAFPGLKAIEKAYKEGVKITGCTVHLVDEGCDTGKILGQKEVEVDPQDRIEVWEARIHEAEHQLYPQVLQELIRN